MNLRKPFQSLHHRGKRYEICYSGMTCASRSRASTTGGGVALAATEGAFFRLFTPLAAIHAGAARNS